MVARPGSDIHARLAGAGIAHGAATQRGRRELLGVDAVAAQQLVQVLAVHVRLAGCPRDVALRALKQPVEVGLLEQLHGALFLLAKGQGRVEDDGLVAAAARERTGGDQVDDPIGREVGAALDDVAQLADIAGPVVGDQSGHRLGPGRAPHAGRQAAREQLDEHRDVLPAVAQRRDLDRDHGDEEVQILAELAGADLLLEAAVGGRQDPDINLELVAAAPPADLAVLERPRHLWLQVERQLADVLE